MRALVALAAALVAAGAPTRTLTSLSTCPAAGSESRGMVARAEVEPSLAVDKAGKRLVVAYQEDRSRRAGAGGIDVTSSADGGRTWRTPVRLFGSCSSEAAPVSDPWVSFGPDGRAYVAALDTRAGVVGAVSLDGGVSWRLGQTIGTQTPSLVLDKPTVTADPSRPLVAYAVWEQYPVAPGRPPLAGDTAVAATRDGGRSWSRPRVILRHSGRRGPLTTNVVVDRSSGDLYALSLWIRNPGPRPGETSRLLLQRSRDGGRSWSAPTPAGTVRSAWVSLQDPATGRGIRPSVPSFAIDQQAHELHLAWADDRFSASPSEDHVVLSSSRDGGRHWSPPRRVDRPGSRLGIIPSVAASGGAGLAVTYYTVDASGARYWLARSRDGGRSFTRRQVGATFELARAPFLTGDQGLLVPGGFFLGDYMSLVTTRAGLATAFVTTNPSADNPTDVRFFAVP